MTRFPASMAGLPLGNFLTCKEFCKFAGLRDFSIDVNPPYTYMYTYSHVSNTPKKTHSVNFVLEPFIPNSIKMKVKLLFFAYNIDFRNRLFQSLLARHENNNLTLIYAHCLWRGKLTVFGLKIVIPFWRHYICLPTNFLP